MFHSRRVSIHGSFVLCSSRLTSADAVRRLLRVISAVGREPEVVMPKIIAVGASQDDVETLERIAARLLANLNSAVLPRYSALYRLVRQRLFSGDRQPVRATAGALAHPPERIESGRFAFALPDCPVN
jgi:hypothetical protein